MKIILTLLTTLAIFTSCKNMHDTRTKITAAEILGDTRYQAICYGGYRDVSRDIQPTIAQIKEDLRILSAIGIKIIRTYNVHLPEAENILKAIKELNKEDETFEMYVMLGAWIDCKNAWTGQQPDHSKESERNAKEIEKAVELTKDYPEIVKIISVGNEAMVKWATAYYVEPEIILNWVLHLQKLKSEGVIPNSVWITSSDNFASWGGGDSLYRTPVLEKLIAAVDYISVHTYPMHDTYYNSSFWNDSANKMESAVNYSKDQFYSVKKYVESLGYKKPIHIGETGWASYSNEMYGIEGTKAANEYNAGVYYRQTREWTNREKVTCFYFEAFDEKWKDEKNPGGSENHFGLFTVEGSAKYAMWKEYNDGLLLGLKRDNKMIKLKTEIFETSANGNKLTRKEIVEESENQIIINIDPSKKCQTIIGFGGAFTESSAYLLNKLSKSNRDKIMSAYFSEDGANYSLTRTHMNSCDFSLGHYSYAPVAEDFELSHFSIKEDLDDLIPMIKDAMQISKDGFKIIASPWTAPPWMKDNHSWIGGKLNPAYNSTWALFFSKYIKEYKSLGIDIWGVTVENEPHGNGNNWESMLFSPQEMTDFVQNHLGPKLEKDGYKDVKILGYDQNRAGLKEWIDEMYRDSNSSHYFDGVAIHWYESTYDYFPDALNYAHLAAPNKMIIQTEACVDAEVPHWEDDKWYWSKEATDWGWDWAKAEEKYLHPKYVPTFRYARDIIGCLNNHVNGWIDWNMVLNRQGGPNWFKNWCVAPIIVDEANDEVYITPLYYVMAHFSKFIRPEAIRIDSKTLHKELMVTAAQNLDGSIVVVLFNPTDTNLNIQLNIQGLTINSNISAKAIQTIRLND